MLDPDLPGNPLATPQIRTIAVLQFDPKFARFGVVPLQLALHQHQPLFELIERNTRRRGVRSGDEGFEIVSLEEMVGMM